MEKRGEHVISLANRLVKQLKPFVRRIEIVGSIRRKSKNPRDIDLVVIPKNKDKIKEFLSKKGKFLYGGEQKAGFRIEGVNIQLYYTILEEWGATLLAFSSKRGSGIGLRIVARTKGFKLNQHGLFKKGKRIAGKTEEEIYRALGRSWKKPENR
ncbi:MAG: hypothetical protein WC438_04050 [Candidatus Pacearchaeota archaeon]